MSEPFERAAELKSIRSRVWERVCVGLGFRFKVCVYVRVNVPTHHRPASKLSAIYASSTWAWPSRAQIVQHNSTQPLHRNPLHGLATAWPRMIKARHTGTLEPGLFIILCSIIDSNLI